MYDPILARWTTQDPLAEKYMPTSPYAFCLNNPVNYIDPNGMEVWLTFSDQNGKEQKMQYEANKEYSGDNSFASNMIGNLNAVYNNGGQKMLDELINSGNTYNITDKLPSTPGAGASFKSNPNGGGTIFAGTIGGNVDSGTVEATGHELFHGAQHEFGQGGSSVFNEVEAYVFGYGVASNFTTAGGSYTKNGSMTSLGNGYTAESALWEASFGNLVTNGFSNTEMSNALNSFLSGSLVGASYHQGLNRMPTTTHGGKVKSLLGTFWIP